MYVYNMWRYFYVLTSTLYIMSAQIEFFFITIFSGTAAVIKEAKKAEELGLVLE